MALETKTEEGESDITTLCDDKSHILKDRLKVMKIQEASTAYRCSNYLANSPNESHYVDSWCRSTMVGWCFQVVDLIGFNRDTVLYAIAYIDRFLSKDSPRSIRIRQDRQQFQLAIMTALFVSIKLHERKIIDISLMMDFSRGVFTKDDFTNMESDLLKALNWRLNGPTSVSFLEHFAHLLPFHECGISACDVLELARYRIELSTKDDGIMCQYPSKVAAAALISSIRSFTTIPEVICHRPKLLNALHEISDINLNSASLRDIIQRTELYELRPFITSRRHSGVLCIQSSCPKESNKGAEGSWQTNSPRGVSQ